MSCWRTYTCDVLKNVDKDIVKEALKHMGVGVDESVKEVHGVYEGRTSACDGVLTKNGEELSLGIVFNDKTGHLNIIGDFWTTGFDSMEFQDELSRTYQRINIETQAELQGWTVDESTVQVDVDGTVTEELYCYA